ncbi:MAG TPA: hypothetical protein DD789_11905 [Firmicutes bacterium]|nr:hypothetical protein [Bacillota bacterium]
MKDKLVQVVSFLWPLDANLAKSRLEADGIRCYFFDEMTITMYWLYSNALHGVKLYVKADDLERAYEILNDENEIELETDDRCPKCNLANIYYENVDQRWLYLSWLLLGIPLPFFHDRWTCRDCGYSRDE